MEKIFATDAARAKDSFHQWHDFCDERIVPMRHWQLVGDSFFASAEGSSVGSLTITKMSLGHLGLETTPQTIRHQKNRSDDVFVSLVLDGSVEVDQNGRSTIDEAGDLGVRDQATSWRIEYDGQTEMVAIELPRHRLESVLGPARHFSGMTVKGDLPGATLARSFLCNRVGRAARHRAPRALPPGLRRSGRLPHGRGPSRSRERDADPERQHR